MNVCCYAHWAGVGGAEDMIIEEIRYADRQKIEYTFVTEEASGESVTLDEIRALGVPVYRLKTIDDFKTVYKDRGIQVLHVMSCGDIQPGYQAAIDLGIPVVDVQACVSYSRGWESFSHTGKIHPVYLCKEHWIHGGGGKSEFRIIEGGVDLAMLSPLNKSECKASWGLDANKIVIGFYGRFDMFKCPLTFYEIAYALRDREDLQFVMWGDGIDRGRVEGLTKQRSCHLTFMGATRNKARAFGAIDIYTMITWQEAFGRVFAEAQACGIPIITSDYEVCRDVCGSSAIYLPYERVDPMSQRFVEIWVARIIDLLNNKEQRVAMSSAGIVNSKRFDAQKMAKEYERLYLEVAN